MVASPVQSQVPPIVRPALDTLQKKLRSLSSDDIRIEDVRFVHGHIHPISHVELSNGQHLLFKIAPYQTTALLRRERQSLRTEAEVLALLKALPDPRIPQLIEPEAHPHTQNPPFLLRHFVRGVPLPEIESSLSPGDWQDIDREIGCFVQLIGQQKSESFGPLPCASPSSGCSTWRKAFLGMIESSLRDAEDTFVSLPYAQIRQELYRLLPALDSVTEPRLVIVDMGKKSHIILNPETKQVSGIVDCSWAVWGDLLMAEVFENPSEAFFEGYGSKHPKDESEHIRLLLFVWFIVLPILKYIC